MRTLTSIAVLIASVAGAHVARAEFVSFEKASGQLQAATVTVRVIPSQMADGDVLVDDAEINEAGKPVTAKKVVVCSGASLGDGLVITYADISAQDEVRITVPGGEQATAKLKVLDHISGLTLLEIDNSDLPKFTAAKELPQVGAWVLSGAGWGSEKPVVSFGILAGKKRKMRGATFPPLLQCDLRTADTSNGAPLVNQQGELIGIVVASGAGEAEARWTYAVPVEHVQRLVRARDPHQVIQIKRVRPVVGMHLDLGPTPNTVIVRRVVSGGPADKAGVKVGDQIIHAEEVAIRSPYQVIGPLLSKQPGETMQFTVARNGDEKQLEIVLGGGTILQPKPDLNNVVGLQSAGQVDVSRRVFLSADGPQQEEIVISGGAKRTASAQTPAVHKQIAELELQHKAITTYLSALQRMQDKVRAQEKALAERDAQIKQLQEQLESLQEDSAR